MWQSKHSTSSGSSYLAGLVAAVLTAGLAYFLDPKSGRRRRSLLRDQLARRTHETQALFGKARRDASQRARGAYRGSLARLRRSPPDDQVLTERIRSELGRLTSHPGAIEVTCSNGLVHLRGDILQDEVNRVLHGVSKLHGVREVANEVRVHADAGSIPTLQGRREVPVSRFEFLKRNWSPAPRVLAGAAGAVMIIAGVGRRSLPGMGLATGGAALLGRSICNMPLSHFVGARTDAEDGVLVQKTIYVDATPEETYRCWRALESFPRFMHHVREVRKDGDTRYHWSVDGPAGIPVEWDAEVTADVPGELIAWHTAAGSAVQSYGVVQFEPSSDGSTRIQVRMSYRPPANLVGHTVAKVFGRDPKHQIDADLARFKTFIETDWRREREQAEVRH